MTQPLVHLSARLDNSFVRPTGGTRHLIVELTPAQVQDSPATPRRPLELALVLDASGSMNGAKLEAVKQAVQLLVQRLDASDSVSIISFASDICVHASSTLMTPEGRQKLMTEVGRLQTRGNTNLSGGWITGMELARSQSMTGRRLAVVLLSDGQANAGITSPDELAKLGHVAAQQGIVTTCVGVGAHYSTAQLDAIAESSGGRFHHANESEAIVQVLLGELSELGSMVAEQVEISVTVPDMVTLQPFATNSRQVADTHHITLGALYSGLQRTVVCALQLPYLHDGTELCLPVVVSGVYVASRQRLQYECQVRLTVSSTEAGTVSSADAVVVTRQAAYWLGRIAAMHNEAGDYAAVERARRSMKPHMDQYSAHTPQAASIWRATEVEVSAAEAPMDPMTLKEMYIRSLKGGRQERELRSRDNS
jgi:Ca-activated chloride channel family protein